jgi:hypothetical protein
VAPKTQSRQLVAISKSNHRWVKKEHEATGLSMHYLMNKAVDLLKADHARAKKPDAAPRS